MLVLIALALTMNVSHFLSVLVFLWTFETTSVAVGVLFQFKICIKSSMVKIPGCVHDLPVLSRMHPVEEEKAAALEYHCCFHSIDNYFYFE